MNTNILFSIIIPTYNTSNDRISRCIDSIIAQTYGNFEIIIVNDGSDETHSEEISRLCSKDKRIRSIYQKNKGSGAARNLGVSNAKGEYVIFIDSDDIVCDHMLSDAYNAINETDADIVCGVVHHEKRSEFETSDYTKYPNKYIVFNSEQKIDKYINNILGDPCQELEFDYGHISDGPVSKACRTSIAKQVKSDEENFWDEDTVWNLTITRETKKICVSNMIWYIYIMNPESQSHRFRPNCLYEFKYRIEQERQIIKKMWPRCINGLYTRTWTNTYILFDTYLTHKKNQTTVMQRYKEFKEAITEPAYIEMLERIRFDQNEASGKRIIKEILRRMSLQGPKVIAFLLWVCMAKIRRTVHF